MTARPIPKPGVGRTLRVIPGGRAVRPHLTPWASFLIFVLIAFFALIWSRTALDRAAFELADLEHRIAAEEARYQELRLEVARLRSPTRIGPLAEQQGLVFPDEVVPIAVDGVITETPPAATRWADVKSILAATP